jgi:hypothetical protein
MNPGDAQLRAQSELQSGESLLWTGEINSGRAAIMALPAALFGIPFAGFALFWMTTAYRGTSHISHNAGSFGSAFKVFPLFGVPFLLIGLGMVLSPLWVYLKGRTGVYAITNQRVMVITGSRSRAVRSITPADIASVDHREKPDMTGDVLIRTNAMQRMNNTMSQVTVGLYGVANVKEVARLVMNLHTQKPA